MDDIPIICTRRVLFFLLLALITFTIAMFHLYHSIQRSQKITRASHIFFVFEKELRHRPSSKYTPRGKKQGSLHKVPSPTPPHLTAPHRRPPSSNHNTTHTLPPRSLPVNALYPAYFRQVPFPLSPTFQKRRKRRTVLATSPFLSPEHAHALPH